MKSIKSIVAAFAALIVLGLTAQAQMTQGQLVPLGGYVQDSAGNTYQVVLQPVPKAPAAPVAAPAPVAAAPVIAQPAPQVVYVQQAPAPQQQVVYVQQAPAAQQGNGLGKYAGDLMVTGAGGATQGAIVAAVTGRPIAQEAAGTAAGTAGAKVVTDLAKKIFGQ